MGTHYVLFSALKAALNATSDTDTVVARLRGLVEEESRALDRLAHRRFDHRIATRYYDAVSVQYGGPVHGYELWLDDDLLSVSSIVSGGETLTGNTQLLPVNAAPWLDNAPADRIRLDPYGTDDWTSSTVQDVVGAIAITGVWGYGGRWVDTGKTLSLAETTTTSATLAGMEQEMILRLGTEYIRVAAAEGSSLTLERGYNGSTAAVQNSATVYRFEPESVVQTLVRRRVAWRLEQEKSPLFGVVKLADVDLPVNVSEEPPDIPSSLIRLGLRRRGRLHVI